MNEPRCNESNLREEAADHSVVFQYVPYSVKLNGSSILYSCCQKFTDTHEYCGNFGLLMISSNFFLQGSMIVQHTSLLTLKNKNK